MKFLQLNKTNILLVFTFVITLMDSTSAWTNTQLQIKSLHTVNNHHKYTTTTTQLNANLINNKSDRRTFINTASTLTVGSIAVVLTNPNIANAVGSKTITTDTTTDIIDTKYYTPKPNSLKDQVILITGGTTGLGLETAKRLAIGGATIIITSRTEKKGNDAVLDIKNYLVTKNINNNNNNNNIYSIQLDLDNLNNVRDFPNRLTKLLGTNIKINTLINNAGVMAIPTKELTIDGYERTFQSNHLGHFLLTNKLIPYLVTDTNARIINVSSSAHSIPGSKGLLLDNLNGEKSYGPWSSYGQSKLANILFSKELQVRALESNKSIIALSLHPGAVQTDLARNLIGTDKWNIMKNDPNYIMSFTDNFLLNTLSKFVLTVEEGASTQIFLASNDSNDILVGGDYYDQCKDSKLESFAKDMSKAKLLWEASERMTEEKFEL